MKTDEYSYLLTTFNAAYSPKTRVCHVPFSFLRLHLHVVRGGICGVAYVRPGVQPVICPDGNGHQAESRKSPHDGQQYLNPTVTTRHDAS